MATLKRYKYPIKLFPNAKDLITNVCKLQYHYQMLVIFYLSYMSVFEDGKNFANIMYSILLQVSS